MAATAPEIQVSAMFPSPSGWEWVHCLTFPVATLSALQFSHRPYKWIRYSTGVVVGAQGHLSLSSDVLQHSHIDYDLDLPTDSVHLFYHTSDAERQRMFPIDPDMGRTHITSSVATTRRADFRSDIIGRDGTCVLTGFRELMCDAAHLIPHSNGNDYIRTYTRGRSREPTGSDVVDNIDDARNGIFLNKLAHVVFGTDIAFLVTPNFAMDTTDVDLATPPVEKRYTAHKFVPNSPEDFGNPALQSGSRVWASHDDDNWPPDILFDAVYANVIGRHFASKALRKALKGWKTHFYREGIRNAEQASHQAIVGERAVQAKRRSEHNFARNERANKRLNRASDDLDDDEDDDDYFDIMILPYVMIPPDKLEAFCKEAKEKRAAEQRKELADKVGSWSKGVAHALRP